MPVSQFQVAGILTSSSHSIQSDSTKAQVVTRGTRSLGYGFVTFATSADAAKSVSMLNGKEIDGRVINVEAVKPLSAGGGPKGEHPCFLSRSIEVHLSNTSIPQFLEPQALKARKRRRTSMWTGKTGKGTHVQGGFRGNIYCTCIWSCTVVCF